MAIRIKSLDDMVREIIASLRAGDPGHPVFSLLLGSGFSVPIIPTPSQMLKGDIAWWRYWKEQKLEAAFCTRGEGITQALAKHEQVTEFEREMWGMIHSKAAASADTTFPLADGLPDLSDPRSVGLAYQAVMGEGLINNRMRRQYLRDAIRRTYPKVNAAHIFLAGILEAQETWDWGAPFCRTIFTTNFDPLLQRSLQLVNKLYYMSDRPDVLEPPDDDESDAIHLVYTHGSVHRYDLRNTGDQISHARERNAPALVGYFQRHGVIVIGYSGWEDTTMEALQRCPSFDSNLYWCDIHPAASAEQRLRPEVLKVLQAGEKNAFYVPIMDAGEAMRLLHRELKLGDVPKFILDPVAAMITQLESIEVPTDPAMPAKPEALQAAVPLTSPSDDARSGLDPAKLQATSLPTALADLRDGTLKRLRIAKSAFDNPGIVQQETQQGQQDVATAIAAKLLSDAFVAYSRGKHEDAIALLSTLIDTPQISARDRATAQFNRGVMLGKNGESEKAIADYTAVIEMAEATPEQKAKVLYSRGVKWGESGETAKAIADYTAVIEMAEASAQLKAMALFGRGWTWGESGETAKAIADYTMVIEIADVTAEQKAMSLNNRGVKWGESGETAKAITDYTAVIEMTDAPAKQKGLALLNRGWRRYADQDDVRSMIEDSRDALAVAADEHNARANLALGLLLIGELEAARVEYETLAAMMSDAAVIRAAIDDLEVALKKRPDIPEAATIIDRLRNRATVLTAPQTSVPHPVHV